MTKIINMTPHPIIILDEENVTIARFESKGQIRLKQKHFPWGNLLVHFKGKVPITISSFGKPEGLPERGFQTYYIVSQLIKSALPNRNDLLVPAEVVRDKDGNIIGCRSLGR